MHTGIDGLRKGYVKCSWKAFRVSMQNWTCLPRHGEKLQIFLKKLKSANPVLPRIVKNAENSKIFEQLGYLKDEKIKIGYSVGSL